MPSNNKYGSIQELLTGAPFLNIQLDAKATPPADLTLVVADFSAVELYGTAVGPLRRGNFALGDVPRILGVGIWCNLADGLVQIQNPDNTVSGLTMLLEATSYNLGNIAQLPTNLFTPGLFFKIQEFNSIQDTDYQQVMTGLNYAVTGQPQQGNFSGTGYYRMNARIQSDMKFATINIDPSYATKRLIMRPMVLVEHTYPLDVAGF